ncbi:MAG: aminoglycoside phosphotransferase, partial [Prevotella sp.]
MNITLNPKYEALRPFLLTIPESFDTVGEVIYQKRNTIKVITEPRGLRLNVKRYHVPKGPNRLVYSWGLRKPKGLRAFQYPSILLAKGIPTPEPVAYIEERGRF